ncbi:MAG: alpha/beta hydrolase [Clostridia bacterium]|nr:alpha/beta hydrolase [Clostridia bacterium]MDE7209716.1 alpha/beta hydrolase [Clostridia bacterium]
MEKIEKTIKGFDDYQVVMSIWEPDCAPKGIVQIFHGMVEHIDRYEDFAHYLNSKGYIVAGDDHRGHGRTAGVDFLGKVPFGHTYFDTIDDEKVITSYLKERYADLPLFVFAHSYGSFLGQGYIQQNSKNIDGCILSGSANMSGIEPKIGRFVANIQHKLYGKDKTAEFIKNMTFGGYEKPFKKEKRQNAWLNRNASECEKYNADKYCNYTMSVGFYKNFFDGLCRIYEPERLAEIDKKLPIFIVAGDKDPVGKMGKLVSKLYDMYTQLGIEDVKIKLYEDARHEIVNELNKDEVYADVSGWLDNLVEKTKSNSAQEEVVADTVEAVEEKEPELAVAK